MAVTSVGLSMPLAEFTVSNSPITTSGDITVNWVSGPTSNNTASTIVKRGASGEFSMGALTGDSAVFGGATASGQVHLRGSGTSGTSAALLVLENSSGGSAKKYGLLSTNSGSFKIVDQTSSIDQLILDSDGNYGLSGTSYAFTRLYSEKNSTDTSSSDTKYSLYGYSTLAPSHV